MHNRISSDYFVPGFTSLLGMFVIVEESVYSAVKVFSRPFLGLIYTLFPVNDNDPRMVDFHNSRSFRFYRPPTNLREGNVFRSVFHSVHREGSWSWRETESPPP